MTNPTQQLSGLLLSVLGWVGSIITCALPSWRLSTVVGTNMMVSQSFSEGLFQICTDGEAGRSHCKPYDSLLEISPALQVGRALVVTSIFTGLFGFIVGLTTFRSSRFVADAIIRNRNTVIAGVIFLVASIMLLIPVATSANNSISDFHNPMVPEHLKREVGPAVYVGLFSFAFLLIGGSVLCSAGLSRDKDNERERKGCSYPMKDYV
ncbi:claudin-3-like [Pogoniulus pusillus]|uniref:claudin-3-like n=1 Tax=Pogoniulus pusillus TaxID=488313 RepID=UPI0030B92D7B